VRWDDAIGTIEEGKFADLTLYKLDQPWNMPLHDIISNLAYAAQASDIDSVFVQGECLYKHREFTTLDKEKIMAEATVRAKSLIQD
jgi:5-methylthioadenosine/S-adenosylhomocysteine deaminase